MSGLFKQSRHLFVRIHTAQPEPMREIKAGPLTLGPGGQWGKGSREQATGTGHENRPREQASRTGLKDRASGTGLRNRAPDLDLENKCLDYLSNHGICLCASTLRSLSL